MASVVARSSVSLMSAHTRWAPSADAFSLTSRPKPLAAPVTMMTLSATWLVISIEPRCVMTNTFNTLRVALCFGSFHDNAALMGRGACVGLEVSSGRGAYRF
jgi:hypothetical protein